MDSWACLAACHCKAGRSFAEDMVACLDFAGGMEAWVDCVVVGIEACLDFAAGMEVLVGFVGGSRIAGLVGKGLDSDFAGGEDSWAAGCCLETCRVINCLL